MLFPLCRYSLPLSLLSLIAVAAAAFPIPLLSVWGQEQLAKKHLYLFLLLKLEQHTPQLRDLKPRMGGIQYHQMRFSTVDEIFTILYPFR